jgi:ribonuclease D
VTRLQHQPKTSITREEINDLPLKAFGGEIQLIDQEEELPRILEEISAHPVIGFDTETRPTFQKGQRHKVALIQLALPKKVFIVRVNQTGITDDILDFLENDKVIKAGIALHDDIKALQRLGPFQPQGFVDLSLQARQKGLQVEGLKKLTGLLLGFRISKGAQTSNWEAMELTEKQLSNSATDARVCLELYSRLTQTT